MLKNMRWVFNLRAGKNAGSNVYMYIYIYMSNIYLMYQLYLFTCESIVYKYGERAIFTLIIV